MKYTIFSFQQHNLISIGLDIIDAQILQYLIDFETSDSDKIKRWHYNEELKSDAFEDVGTWVDNYVHYDTYGKPGDYEFFEDGSFDVYRYTWLYNDKLLSDLPILGIKKRQLRNRLLKLESVGVIKTIVVRGKYSYFRTVPDGIEELQSRNCNVTSNVTKAFPHETAINCRPITESLQSNAG